MRELHHLGLLLEILTEMTDVERQVTIQGHRPGIFVPDDLLDRWYNTFYSTRPRKSNEVSEAINTLLVEFSLNLDQLTAQLPEDVENKENYIRYDDGWRTVRELAQWTLTRITLLTIPDEPIFSNN
jgi:hypothetical protein